MYRASICYEPRPWAYGPNTTLNPTQNSLGMSFLNSDLHYILPCLPCHVMDPLLSQSVGCHLLQHAPKRLPLSQLISKGQFWFLSPMGITATRDKAPP